jgi:hypothetical protein
LDVHERLDNRSAQNLRANQIASEPLERSHPNVAIHNSEQLARACHDEDRVLLSVLLERGECLALARRNAKAQVFVGTRQEPEL